MPETILRGAPSGKLRYETISLDRVPPEALQGYRLPDASAAVAAIDEEGRVVAVWCAMMVLHTEPLWVREDYRKHPTLLRRLWATLKALLGEVGAKQAVSVVLDDKASTQHLAGFTGARKLPGSVWMLDLTKEGN